MSGPVEEPVGAGTGLPAPAPAVAVVAKVARSRVHHAGRTRRVGARGGMTQTGRARTEAAVRPILFGALDSGDLDLRAIDALRPRQQRALEALAGDLLPSVRGPDREVLVRLLDRRGAVEAARRQTRSKRAGQRIRAGQFLADAGTQAAVHSLLDLLHDPSPQVRWSAARGLGRLGHLDALSPLLASLEGARPIPVDIVADAIVQIRNCPVSVLRQGLKSRSVPTRAVAVELLGRFQAAAAADDVVALLHHDPSVEVRARAARCLGRIGTPRTVDPLLSCLGSGPVAMRVQAIWALGEIGAPQAIPALRGILLGESRQVAELAASALVAIGPLGIRVLTEVAALGGHSGTIAADALTTCPDLEPALP